MTHFLNLIYIKFKTVLNLPIIESSALFSFKINKVRENTMSLVNNNLYVGDIINLLTDEWASGYVDICKLMYRFLEDWVINWKLYYKIE